MKLILLLLFIFSAINSMSAVSDEVFIKGKIGNIFDEDKVKVIDSLGQTYMLPKKLFPKGFEFKQGKEFSMEVPSKELAGLKVKKP